MPINFSKIRELREAAGLSQEEAALRAGVKKSHKQWWAAYEKGRRKSPSYEVAERIASALSVTPGELFS